jgi:hypothetical protein
MLAADYLGPCFLWWFRTVRVDHTKYKFVPDCYVVVDPVDVFLIIAIQAADPKSQFVIGLMRGSPSNVFERCEQHGRVSNTRSAKTLPIPVNLKTNHVVAWKKSC